MRSPSKRLALSLFAIGTAALLGSSPSASTDSSWRRFELEDQGLSVLVPGAPTKSLVHDRSFIGDVVTNEYVVNDGLDSYSVEFTDLPGFAVRFAGSERVYTYAEDSLLAVTLSKAISSSDIILNGIEGKRLVYDTPTKPDQPEMQGEARFFLSGNRLYIADAVVEMDGGQEKLRRFFSSLEIENLARSE